MAYLCLVRPEQHKEIEPTRNYEETTDPNFHPATQQNNHRSLRLNGLHLRRIGTAIIIFGNEKLKILAIIYILMPIIMGIFGFIFFVIFAAIYNLLAKWLGGVEVEVKDITNGA